MAMNVRIDDDDDDVSNNDSLNHQDTTMMISREQFIDTERIDKSRCGGGDGSARNSTDGNSSSVNLPEGWCLNNESMPFYVGHQEESSQQNKSSFVVRRYNHKGYERCLANKTLVFIGDSRARYQFMYLASYLQSKKHMKCKDAFPSIEQDDECGTIMREGEKGMFWPGWYRWSTAELSKDDDQNVLCDCYRKRNVYDWINGAFENRFLKRSTPYGEINIIYLQDNKNWVQMSQEFPPYSTFFPSSLGNNKNRCEPGKCTKENKNIIFKGDLNATMWNILPLLNTTHAFVNLGWEGMKQRLPSPMSNFSCEIHQFTQHHPDIQMSFLTHIPSPGYTRDMSYPPIAETMKCKIDVLDRYQAAENVPNHWYYDKVHVGSNLNREYNHQLLEYVCPLS